jgi:predicted phosphohydrolase
VKILLTADLHFHRPWFEWLLAEAPNFDLICVAGDLFSLEDPSGFIPQMVFLYDWISRFSRQPTPIALCSGNHDLPPGSLLVQPGIPIASKYLSTISRYAQSDSWMQALKITHRISVDGDQKIVRTKSGEAVAIICCRYRADGGVDRWAQTSGNSLVLHHEPPASTSLSMPKTGNGEFPLILRELKPTWCVSGHVHFTPGEENSFLEKIGQTYCFNCRQTPPSGLLPPRPNVIVLDTTSKTAAWRRWFSGTSYDETVAKL